MNPATSLLESKTIRVAFVFAAIGIGAVAFDTAMGVLLAYQVRYIPELFALLSAMFAGVAVKNGADNFIDYRRETVQYQATGTLPAAPVSQASP